MAERIDTAALRAVARVAERQPKNDVAHTVLAAMCDPRTVLALLAEIDALRAAQQWQPIESAPKDGTWVLLWDARHEVAVSGRWWHEPTMDTPSGYEPGWDGWSADDDLLVWDDPTSQPTHWMLLPAPPADAKGGA